MRFPRPACPTHIIRTSSTKGLGPRWISDTQTIPNVLLLGYLLIKKNAQFESQPARTVGEDEFISALLKRQDSVLESLDELNSRIEQAILDIGKARQESNELAEEPQANESGETRERSKVEIPVSKAA